jgi:two-component system sensor histidine kinase KdpD
MDSVNPKLSIAWLKTVVLPYLFALVAIALTTGILVYLQDYINPAIIALLYLLPVVLSAAYGGLGPGILAALSAFLAFNYFFIQPLYTLMVHQTQDILGLVVFIIVAFAISQAFGTARRNLAAAQAREREAVQLYELSSELSGLQEDQAVMETLARKMMETFQPERLDLLLEESTERQPLSITLLGSTGRNPDKSRPAPEANCVIPLQNSRGLVGEIRLWRMELPLSPAEERLLQIFASQGLTALERARLTQAENRAKLLEESDRLKTSLLSSVSHELRTPLSAIKASVTGLRSEMDALDIEARDELLAAIEEETDHLNLLVGNLLDMSRIEAGALKPQRAWNAISEIVADALKRMHTVTQNHSILLNIPEDLPLVPVDYVQLEQVFVNLVSNSVKYSPIDTTIWISAQVRSDQFLLVEVKNQGPHVPQESLERIFDKFHRVTAADRITGAGLGLSICKGIIEAHSGRIWAENLPTGFAYYFTLPITWEGAPLRLPDE